MMILENDLEIAPCLSEGLISDTAQDAIVAARALGKTRWASVARAWSVAYLFSRMGSIFASGQDPVAALRCALDDLTEFLAAAAKCGLAAVGEQADEDLERLDDRRSIEGVTGEHYGRLFERFSEASYWQEPSRLLSLRLTRNGIDTSSLKGKEVLDAGCGAGRYTVAWHLLGASRTVGIDVSSVGIQDARRRIAKAGIGGVEFEEGNVLQLPFEDNSFDIVFSNGVLHHTADWQAGVGELTRVLRRGGLGWLYLIEKPGGLFWDLIEVMRAIMKDEKRDVIRAALRASGTPANHIFYMLDHVLAPINLRLTPEEIESCLAKAGASGIRRLARGSDFDRIERIYQKEPYADVKYGVGENRYVFSKD